MLGNSYHLVSAYYILDPEQKILCVFSKHNPKKKIKKKNLKSQHGEALLWG